MELIEEYVRSWLDFNIVDNDSDDKLLIDMEEVETGRRYQMKNGCLCGCWK